MNQAVTIQELLALPPLNRCRIVSGWTGKTKPVDADLIKIVDTTENLDELVSLDSQQWGAVIVAGSTRKDATIPYEARQIFDSAQLPLVLYEYSLSTDEIRQALQAAAFLKNSGQLKHFLHLVPLNAANNAGRSDLPTLMQRLQNYILNPAILIDSACHLIACGADDNNGLADIAQLLSQAAATVKTARPVTDHIRRGMMHDCHCGQIPFYLLPITSDGTNYGHIIVFELGVPLNDVDLCHLALTGSLISHELQTRRQAENIEQKYQADFIYDILYNNFESRDILISRGRFWGWDFTNPHHLLIIKPDETTSHEMLSRLQQVTAASLRCQCHRPIVSEVQGLLVTIIPEYSPQEEPKTTKRRLLHLSHMIQAKIESQLSVTVSIGIGRTYPSASELCRSFQEAKTSVELGRFLQDKQTVTHFEELGVIRLLAQIGYEQLDDFCHEYLAPLADYDAKAGTNFLQTLQAYFQHNGDLNLIAEKLYMHPNTLRYRLRKIEELLDYDLQKFEDRLNLYVACKIARLRDLGRW